MRKQVSTRFAHGTLLALIAYCATVCPLVAEDVLLTWNPNEENDIEGYKVYYGMAPGNYSTSLMVGNQTSYTIEGLVTGFYYFSVTALNKEGLESDFSNEVSYAAGEPFSTTLVFPRFVSGAPGAGSPLSTDPPASAHLEENTGMAVANLDATNTTIRFTAFDKGGGMLQGTGVTNPESRSLEKGEQIPILDREIFGTGVPALNPNGWIKLESTAAKIVGFFLVFNDNLDFLDGADVSSRSLEGFLFPEIESEGFTQLHAANPTGNTANVTVELRNDQGEIRATVARAIAPNGALAEYVSDLFTTLTPSKSDYLLVTSDEGLVPFEYFGKTGQFVAGLNGQDSSIGATTLYCPQYAIGGGFATTLSAISLDGAGNVSFRFIRDDGTQIGSIVVRSIEAKGKIFVAEQDFFLPDPELSLLTQGYVEISSDGPKLAGSVVFGDPDRSRFSSSLPLISGLETGLVFGQVASNDTYFMGLALLNPQGSNVSVTVEIFDKDGQQIRSVTFEIGPLRRISKLLTEYFEDLVGIDLSSGYIRITAEEPIAGFALFGTHDLSVLSAVPAQITP